MRKGRGGGDEEVRDIHTHTTGVIELHGEPPSSSCFSVIAHGMMMFHLGRVYVVIRTLVRLDRQIKSNF